MPILPRLPFTSESEDKFDSPKNLNRFAENYNCCLAQCAARLNAVEEMELNFAQQRSTQAKSSSPGSALPTEIPTQSPQSESELQEMVSIQFDHLWKRCYDACGQYVVEKHLIPS